MTRDKDGVTAKLKTQCLRFQYYSSLEIVLNFWGKKTRKSWLHTLQKMYSFTVVLIFFFLVTNFREQ